MGSDRKTCHTTRSDAWPEVTIRHPASISEALNEFLFELGATAVWQNDQADTPDTIVTTAGFKKDRDITDLAPQLDRHLERLVEIFSLVKPVPAEWIREETGDWAEKWKEGLEAIPVGQSLLIKPSWKTIDYAMPRAVIEIDPGMAFGTGRHATTMLCLLVLDDIANNSGLQGLRILDVGTGSGILAMAAAVLGGENILAVDIDPEVMPVAQKNIDDNQLTDRVHLVCGGPDSIRGSYDLILANLTALTLIEMAPQLTRLCSPKGRLVLSGILAEQAPGVEKTFRESGLFLHRRLDREEWTCIVAGREELS